MKNQNDLKQHSKTKAINEEKVNAETLRENDSNLTAVRAGVKGSIDWDREEDPQYF
jgi:hypothetical protein